MRSLMSKAFFQIAETGKLDLFMSHREEYAHGEQLRDFVYVKDAVAMTLFFFENPEIGGVFNIGTGTARTWNDVASALFNAMGKERSVQYIPMPDHLRGKYQYYTCADVQKLHSVGCTHQCMTLEEAVTDYVCNYLIPGRHLGDECR